MGVDQRQDPVGSYGLQAHNTHQQPAYNAALYIEAVARKLVDVRSVDHVGMGDQPVADRTQQLGYGRGIPSVPPDGRSYPRGHQQYRVKLACVLPPPLSKLENGTPGQLAGSLPSAPAFAGETGVNEIREWSMSSSYLAFVTGAVRLGDHQPYRRSLFREALPDIPVQPVQKTNAVRRFRDKEFDFRKEHEGPSHILTAENTESADIPFVLCELRDLCGNSLPAGRR